MRRRLVPLAAAAAAAATLVSGCGLTDEAPRPGVAAEVEGETLELSRVDRAVEDYCALLEVNEQASAVPTAQIRSQFALGWTQAIAVEKLAEEYGVALPGETIDEGAVEEAWGALGEIDDDNYETFEWLTWIRLRLSAPVEQIGAEALQEETGELASGQPALDRGVALIGEWLEENDPELNPVFGELDPATGFFSADTLSVPVSGEAQAVADTSALTAEEVAALPDSQRCGPATAPTAQVPGA